MARKPKAKRQPPPRTGPSGLTVVLAFAAAVGVAAALVVAALVARSGGDDAAPATPQPVVELDGIPQEGTVLGSPDARVTLIEYADLQCPACRAYAETVLPTVVDGYVRPGDVKAEFRGIAFIGPDSLKALRFVSAAGLQDRLWHLQEALYRNQGGENSGWVTDELVRRLAAEIEGLDVERLFADAESDAVDVLIEQGATQADEDDVRGTPTVFVRVGSQQPYMLSAGLSATDVAAALDDALGQ